MELFGGLSVLGIALLVIALLALFMPVFVFQIRNEIISTNKKLGRIIDLLEKDDSNAKINKLPEVVVGTEPEINRKWRGSRTCPKCGRKLGANILYCPKCGGQRD